MTVLPFIAESAPQALDQIRAELGPQAVVLNVRRLPVHGLRRLWKRYGPVEVLAGLPDEPAPAPAPEAAARADEVRADFSPAALLAQAEPPTASGPPDHSRWRSRALLERVGLLPLQAEFVLETVRGCHGDEPPASLYEEMALCCHALAQHWRPPPPLQDGSAPRPHVFVGPPGSGKSTALCKWLAHTVLLDGRSARVWRLDAHAANTAELLSVYGDILGVPVERFWAEAKVPPAEDFWFVDLPGVDPQDRAAFEELAARVRQLPAPRVHLVLNAAYDTPLLLAQARAFSALAPEDLICTHLDEETRWVRLWNLVVGTNFTIRFLGAGQNIPGRLLSATPEQLLPIGFRPPERETARISEVSGRWQMTC